MKDISATPLFTAPKHEPELLLHRARRRDGSLDYDKVATTSLDGLVFHGVRMTSRYKKAQELDFMLYVLRWVSLAPRRLSLIESFFADSKSATYVVRLRQCGRRRARAVRRDIARLASYRHSGIYFQWAEGVTGLFDLSDFYVEPAEDPNFDAETGRFKEKVLGWGNPLRWDSAAHS